MGGEDAQQELGVAPSGQLDLSLQLALKEKGVSQATLTVMASIGNPAAHTALLANCTPCGRGLLLYGVTAWEAKIDICCATAGSCSV